jgi:hypothetical protein
VRFSVSIQAEGDREVSLEEVVELADAVAGLNGIASGYGTMGYGAQIVVEADGSDEAVDKAIKQFTQAVGMTSLPLWPVTSAKTLSEDEDFGDLESDLQ